MTKAIARARDGGSRVSLKFLAEHLRLSPSTISYVLNETPGRAIPETTRDRVRQAAAEFNYQPSMIARTLRGKPMQTIGILLPELGEGYHSQVLSGVGDLLIDRGYLYFTVHHRHKPELIRKLPGLLLARGVDGILAIDTDLREALPLPATLVGGQSKLAGVTNVRLDHELAAELALRHLFDLGHREIVFMRGQTFSTDTELRWRATTKAARALGVRVDRKLTVKLDLDSSSPGISYPGVEALLERRARFTAVVCFNDVSAMGTIRALHDAGLRVPKDVSVLGFDDIQSASFHLPSMSTIRQPLKEMGSTGAELLLRKLAGERLPGVVCVKPELVVRESTAKVRKGR